MAKKEGRREIKRSGAKKVKGDEGKTKRGRKNRRGAKEKRRVSELRREEQKGKIGAG